MNNSNSFRISDNLADTQLDMLRAEAEHLRNIVETYADEIRDLRQRNNELLQQLAMRRMTEDELSQEIENATQPHNRRD